MAPISRKFGETMGRPHRKFWAYQNESRIKKASSSASQFPALTRPD